MSDLTIHNFSKNLQQRLARRAARQGRSAEAEAREILREAVRAEPNGGLSEPEKGLATAIHKRVMTHGGYDSEPQDQKKPMSGKELYERIRALVEPYGGFDLEPPKRDRTPLVLPPPISDE